MHYFIHQFVNEYAGPGIFATVLLTITMQDITLIVPIASGILVLIGQAVKWYRDDVRKQTRHDLFMAIGDKMMKGEIPYDGKFMEKLAEDAD